MPTKQLKKQDWIRHPIGKQRLRIVDSFAWPSKSGGLSCPLCSGTVDRVLVVESEPVAHPIYYVLACGQCKKHSWHVIESPKK